MTLGPNPSRVAGMIHLATTGDSVPLGLTLVIVVIVGIIVTLLRNADPFD